MFFTNVSLWYYVFERQALFRNESLEKVSFYVKVLEIPWKKCQNFYEYCNDYIEKSYI